MRHEQKSCWFKNKEEREVTHKELYILQIQPQVPDMFQHCSVVQSVDEKMSLLESDCVSPKTGSSTTTGSLMFEIEADTTGKCRPACWPAN